MKNPILCCLILIGMISCGQSSTDNDKAEPVKEDTVAVNDMATDDVKKETNSGDTILIPTMGENGLYGYQDSAGNWIIKPQFKAVGEFSSGIAPVLLNEPHIFYVINTRGNTFHKVPYDFISVHNELSGETKLIGFSEGLIPVMDRNEKIGFMDRKNKLVIPFKYDEVQPFCCGLSGVQINGKYGFIDKNHEMIIQPKYDNAFMFSFNRAIVVLNGEFYILDKNGKIYNERPFLSAFRFKEGLTFVSYSDKYMDYFIIDTMCNVIHKGPYEYIYNLGFENGECEVMKNGKCIIIDNTGKKIRDKKNGCQEGC